MNADTSLDKACLTVNLLPVSISGIIVGLIFFLLAVLIFVKEPIWGIFGFILAGNILIYTFTLSGRIEMNKRFIAHKSLIGKFKMSWDEVKRIDQDLYKSNLVFIGENKQLAIPGKSSWSGKDKKDMVLLFNTQLEEKNITVRNNVPSAFYFAFSKNTRIPKS